MLLRFLRSASMRRKMRRDWDARARSDAFYFVNDARKSWTEEDFYQSGEESVRDEILNDMINICQGRRPQDMRILEIGCGAGRMTGALANLFGEVHAVDVSPAMIALARKRLGDRKNIRFYATNGADLSALPPVPFDFAFSFIVFQHIPSREVIESYVRDVHRVLAPGALFKFQVQGCCEIERARDDTWLGVPISESDARAMADRSGFECRYAVGAGTPFFRLWFYKQ